MAYSGIVNTKHLKNFLRVLDRYGISYTLKDNNDEDYAHIVTSLSAQEFKRYVERAMCEYESETIHNGRFVISFNELMNYKSELKREFFPDKKGMVYHILSKDQDKLHTLCGQELVTGKIGNKHQYAIGDIKLDGIEPTEEFKEYAKKESQGTLTNADVKNYLNKPYQMSLLEDFSNGTEKER